MSQQWTITLGDWGCERSFLSYRLHHKNFLDNRVEILNIEARDRRKGQGRELVSRLEKKFQSELPGMFAITRRSNLIANDFYHGVGFELSGLLKNFYSDSSDVLERDAFVYIKDFHK